MEKKSSGLLQDQASFSIKETLLEETAHGARECQTLFSLFNPKIKDRTLRKTRDKSLSSTILIIRMADVYERRQSDANIKELSWKTPSAEGSGVEM